MNIDFSLLKEWIPVIMFLTGLIGSLWKMSSSLNTTLQKLNFEISRLSENITETKVSQAKMEDRVDKADDRLDDHEVRISVIEAERKVK